MKFSGSNCLDQLGSGNNRCVRS